MNSFQNWERYNDTGNQDLLLKGGLCQGFSQQKKTRHPSHSFMWKPYGVFTAYTSCFIRAQENKSWVEWYQVAWSSWIFHCTYGNESDHPKTEQSFENNYFLIKRRHNLLKLPRKCIYVQSAGKNSQSPATFISNVENLKQSLRTWVK